MTHSIHTTTALTAEPAAIEDGSAAPGEQLLGAVLAHTTTRGAIRDLAGAIAAVHERGGLVAVDADPLALTVLREPGAVGADIAVGSAQRLGVPLFYGGPHPGFMAVADRLRRQVPGRIVGVSRDSEGHEACRLALQTREQHIRRERATSNICTAQALLAVVAAFYAVHHGPEGLRAIAGHAHAQAARIAAGVRAAGLCIEHESFFDTLSVVVPGAAERAVARAEELGYNLRLLDADHVGLSTNETTTDEDIAAVLEALTGRRPAEPEPDNARVFPLPHALRRESAFLTHPAFHDYRSEPALVRYLRRLADRDLALDRTMIPLGSCTLKLNAAAQSALWLTPELAGIHPYAPSSQTRGWRLLLTQLSERLAALTGYDRVSLQPASGAQGELAGLLAIGAGVAALVWVLVFSPLLALRTADITVSGSDGSVDAAAVQEALAGHAGTSLVRLDVTALGDEVTDDLVRVKSAAVTRSWPHGLAVALTMRVPVAQHRTDAGYEVLDGEAVVLETTEQPQSGLAEVTADEGAALTQEQVGAVAEAVGSLDSSVRPQVASGSATTTGQVTLVLSSGAHVVWGDSTDSDLKAEVLKVLLQQSASTYDVSSPHSPTTS